MNEFEQTTVYELKIGDFISFMYLDNITRKKRYVFGNICNINHNCWISVTDYHDVFYLDFITDLKIKYYDFDLGI